MELKIRTSGFYHNMSNSHFYAPCLHNVETCQLFGR